MVYVQSRPGVILHCEHAPSWPAATTGTHSRQSPSAATGRPPRDSAAVARKAANLAVVGRAQESQLGPTGCELTAEITPTGVVRRSSRNTRCGRSRVANLATQPDDAKN